MSAHLTWSQLVDYWADDHSEPALLEEHLMGCAECSEASARVAAVTRALGTLLPPLLSSELLGKLQARGLRIGETVFRPGERKEMHFPADRDLMVMRLEGLPDDLVRLDFEMCEEASGTPLARLDDAPFTPGAALLACQQHYASLPPDVIVRLHATHRDGTQSQTQYTVLHRFATR